MAVRTENTLECPDSLTSHEIIGEDSREHLRTVALRTYSGQKKQWFDDKQITQLLPMVHKIAHRVVAYLKPPLSFEDLISAGTIGLLKAARDFDSSRQAAFKTYAYIRIKGAILDELRSLSLLPVNFNKQVLKALELSRRISEQTGTVPTTDELAEKLGISVDKVYELFGTARAQHFVSMDGFGQDRPALCEFLASTDTAGPDSRIERTELIDKLTKAIQQLDQKRRQIILLYYHQHLTMKQIADIMSITESRVSQLHASAIFNLSVKLRKWKDG